MLLLIHPSQERAFDDSLGGQTSFLLQENNQNSIICSLPPPVLLAYMLTLPLGGVKTTTTLTLCPSADTHVHLSGHLSSCQVGSDMDASRATDKC